MGWSDNIEEIEKVEAETDVEDAKFIKAIRGHVDNLKSQIEPMKNCCPQHGITARCAENFLDYCLNDIIKDNRENGDQFSTEVMGLIGGTSNILGFLLSLVPHNDQRRKIVGDVIKLLESSLPGLNPEDDSDESGRPKLEEGEFEIAPGVKAHGFMISGSSSYGKDIAAKIAEMLSGIIGDPDIPTKPKNKLH
jgi:hypothetical protein